MRTLSLLVLLLLATASNATFAAQNIWQQTEPMITPRTGAGVLEVNGVIYAIGGVDGHRFLPSSESSVIQKDGSLASWREESDLNVERGFFGVTAHNGFIYAVGGGNDLTGHHLLRTVERAAILADGRLGPWRRESEILNLPRRCAKVVTVGDYLYAIGGFGGVLLDSIERAHIKADGSLGPWEIMKDKLTMPRYIHAEAEVNGRLYILGGHAQEGGMGEAATEYASLKGDKALTHWQTSIPMQNGRYGLTATSHGNFLYAMGGMNGASFSDVIEKNHVDKDGALGVWKRITPLPSPLADFGAVVHGDFIYVVGGTSPDGYFNNVFYARLDKIGDLTPARAGAVDTAPAAPVNRVELPNSGVVTQSLEGGTYIYLEVDTGHGKEWMAAAHADIAVGDHIEYSDGIWMEDFFSKFLQRRFKAIRFVGNLQKVSGK